MGCCQSSVRQEPNQQPTEEPYPEDGKKLRTDATLDDCYKLGTTIGYGGFSKVRLATDRATGEQFACKIMPLPRRGHKYNEHMTTRAIILSEIDVLLDLEHPNVVGLKEYFVHHNKVYLIMELLRGGELLDAVVEKGHYSEEDARTIFVQLVRGIQYLHNMGVVHRDIKLDNLLLNHPGDITSIKIADFGFAKKHPRGDGFLRQSMKTICGTPEYMAPEVLKGSRNLSLTGGSCSSKGAAAAYGPACDLWSAGVVLYMLLAGSPPFAESVQPVLFRDILAARYSFDDPGWASVSHEAKDLVSRLLVADPQRRFTCEQVLAHPWTAAASTSAEPLPAAARKRMQASKSRRGRAPLLERVASALADAAAEAAASRGGDGQPRRSAAAAAASKATGGSGGKQVPVASD